MTRRLSRHALQIRNRGLILELLERRDVPSFAAPQAFPAGLQPAAIASADFNGDSANDLVVANQTTPGKVNVLLNSGAGVPDTPKSFPTGGSKPNSVAVGDVSGDGKLDLVVTNYDSGTLAVLRGSGTGFFRRPISYAAGTAPTSLKLGDFNGDAILDAAVANDGTNTMSVLLGQGNGAFQLFSSYDIGTKIRAVTVGDFDNDGTLDLVGTGYNPFNGNGFFKVYLGNGDGTFWAVSNNPGQYEIGLAPGDLNADGNLDLIESRSGGSVRSWLGQGNGLFQAGSFHAVDALPVIDVADLDNDGRFDLVAAGQNARLMSFISSGNGVFEPPQSYAAGGNPLGVVSTDLTGDGIVDIAIANGTSNAITIQVGHGDGTFTAFVPIYPVVAEPMSLAQADFNQDGVPDITVGTNDNGQVNVSFGVPGGGFQFPLGYPAGKDAEIVVAADFTGDAIPDIAAANNIYLGALGHLTLLENKGDGTFPTPPAAYPAGDQPRGITVADFNGDGILDAATAARADLSPVVDTVSVQLGSGGGAFGAPVSYHTGFATNDVQTGDFDGDGFLDLVTGRVILRGNGDGTFKTAEAHGATGLHVVVADLNGDNFLDIATASGHLNDYVKVLRSNGDGTFQLLATYIVEGHPWGIAAGNFNGDNVLDLVTANSANDTIGVLLGIGGGAFQTASYQNAGIEPYSQPFDVEVGDFDGDGHADVVVPLGAALSVVTLRGNGDGTFQDPVPYSVGVYPGPSTLADLNDDGELDIAVIIGCNGCVDSYPAVCVLRGNGDGTFGLLETYLAGPNPSNVAAGDFDGDAIVDLLIPNYFAAPNSQAALRVLRGDNVRFDAVRAYLIGPNPLAVTYADLNGDGFQDVAVGNDQYDSADTVSVLINNGSGDFFPYASYLVGQMPTGVAIGDFNADGIPDIATANNASNTVSILLGNGDGAFQPAAEYAAGTVHYGVVAADFDGDGKVDLAVTNNLSAGTVSILKGRGDGTFLAPVSFPVSSEPRSIVASDFNGDGIPDIAVAGYAGGMFSVLLGTGAGDFETLHFAIGTQPRSLITGDFDDDGWMDLAAIIAPGPLAAGVGVLLNDGIWPPLPIGGGPRPVPPLDVFPTTEKPRPPTTPRPARIDLAMQPANVEGTNNVPGPQHVKRAIARLAVAATAESELDLLSIEIA